jgi:G protein-coupled receptor GPR1
MAMWALPFISHVLQYNDCFAANPPFVLSAIVTVIAVSQSVVDCWIFNIKEKPWRQSVKSNGSVVRGLADLKGLRRLSQLVGRGGKSKGAMEEEARFAYQCRARRGRQE